MYVVSIWKLAVSPKSIASQEKHEILVNLESWTQNFRGYKETQ